MLTGDLVRARAEQGVLKPGFVDPASARLLERADALLTAFREGVGRKRSELDAEVDAITGEGVDQRLSRGLVKVLQDRAEFGVEAAVAPAELRMRVFREAARRGPLGAVRVEGGAATVEDVYAAVAGELGVDAALLPEALYADHPDEQVLRVIDVPSAEWLLRRYNVALVQALLLHAEELDIELAAPTPARARQLFRAVKFHQLIFAATRAGDGYRLRIDGPASLFSQTTRYGVALAKFFPSLLLQPGPWRVTAAVKWRRFRPTLTVTDADGLVSHYRDVGAYETREAAWFAERFAALDSGWELVRDAAPLSQGGEGVVVPDFSFRKDGRVAHLEILGFWRKGTVARRLDLLRRHGPPNLVLAVSRRLCGDEADELSEAVVPFAEVIPAKEVLRRVEERARPP